jgi:hypothetical protein
MDNNVLTEAQNGFRKNKSTDSKPNFYCKYTGGLRGLHAIGLFLDLSKAYDVINHNILLDKLNAYGIGEANLWFKPPPVC